MAHRGRLNVLANIVGKSYAQIFREFEGNLDPKSMHGSGDVKYHLGAEGTFTGLDGEQIKVSLAANPSHLETVDPVIEGIARAKQDIINKGGTDFTVLPVALHGDAAFAGQGVVAETLNMSQLRGYRTGGTVHVVINNQVGFTAAPESSRSSMYATDVARMIEAPIFHVNGDDPEAVVRVARLAFEFRQAFNKDVVIDLICYRRRGHNESRQPGVHPAADVRPDRQEALGAQALHRVPHRSRRHHPGRGRAGAAGLPGPAGEGLHRGPRGRRAAPAQAESRTPQAEFPVAVHDRGLPGGRQADRRVPGQHPRPRHRPPAAAAAAAAPGGDGRGRHDRLGHGRDPRHRLAAAGGHPGPALRPGLPPRHLRPAPRGPHRPGDRRGLHPAASTSRRTRPATTSTTRCSPSTRPWASSTATRWPARTRWCMWEAQFGDFVNGAQTVVDEYISSAEQKWGQTSGVTLLLPHGYEGQGPDHSSARIERFLQLCAQNNMTVAMPTLPVELLPPPAVAGAQPAPQAADRLHPEVDAAAEGRGVEGGGVHHGPASARSSATTRSSAAAVRKVVFCAGKVYYDLEAERKKRGATDTAIIRIERLYPLPGAELQAEIAKYPNAEKYLWAQEEPANQGAWPFIALNLIDHLDLAVGADVPHGERLRRISRPHGSSPAVGSAKRHQAEQEQLVREVFEASEASAHRDRRRRARAPGHSAGRGACGVRGGRP